MPPWDRYAAPPQANPPPGGGGTLVQRGSQVTGMPAQRAQARGAAAVQQRQEQAGSTALDTMPALNMQLHWLGQSRRLVDSGVNTGPLAPETLWTARTLQSTMHPALDVLHNFGMPNDSEIERLGTLDKNSQLLATAMASAMPDSTDADRTAIRERAVFGIDRDRRTNTQNINSLTRQTVSSILSAQIRQLWRTGLGDENAVEPQTGLTAAQYLSGVMARLPENAGEYEDPQRLRRALEVTTSRGSFNLGREMEPTLASIATSLRGSNDFAPAPQRTAARPSAGQPRFIDLRPPR